MALFDKINEFAKTATEKTESAIESAKLSAKIESENRTMSDIVKKIGAYYVTKLDAGETLDEEVMNIYSGILECRKRIAEYNEEKEALRAPKEETPAAEN